MFKAKIHKLIENKQLISEQDRVLVALSGGADSVALLRVLLQLGYQCEAAHCNFHLRGEESDRDELFVRRLCDELHVNLHVVHFATEEHAKEHGLSIEMAARELRYAWFEELRVSSGQDVIAVAHHLDDSVETFLLNLARGTGINGLKGIPIRNGFIVRPLLEVTREEILDYLKYLHQDYVTDSTNLEDVYMRNKIRLDIIPLFRLMNPSFCESISETSKRLSEVAAVYNDAIKQALRRVKSTDCSVSIPQILKEISPASILYEWLSPYGFNSSQIQDILRSATGESGRMFYSKEWKLLRDREEFLLRKIDEPQSLPVLETMVKKKDKAYKVCKEKSRACLDADKVHLPLELRKWRSGDTFIPYGMKGKKKVRDYMRDRKFSLYKKEEQLVVVSQNEIIWLVNERVDQRYCVTDETQNVLEISIK